MHGHGIFTLADGYCYEGEFDQQNKHGKGTEKWHDGTKYVGQFFDN